MCRISRDLIQQPRAVIKRRPGSPQEDEGGTLAKYAPAASLPTPRTPLNLPPLIRSVALAGKVIFVPEGRGSLKSYYFFLLEFKIANYASIIIFKSWFRQWPSTDDEARRETDGRTERY